MRQFGTQFNRVHRPGERAGGLVVELPGKVLQVEGELQVGIDGRLYRYDGGVYNADGEAWARGRLRRLLGDRWKRGHADEVVSWLKATTPFIGTICTPGPGYLNVANGLLHLGTLELHPHTPKVPSTIQLPAAWNPDATCPAIERFLGQVLPGVDTQFIYEAVGYTLYTDNPYSKAFMMLGDGANGKSVLLKVRRSLLGPDNYSVVPLQQLAENRFAGAELFGKLANICGDIDARAIKRTDLFKQITGGDPIQAERKYGHPFTFTAFATPWFSANEAPITSDQTDAWFRRWIILPFTQKFDPDRADPFLANKLTTTNEMTGLLVAAVHGLRRVMERGRFDAPAAIEDASSRYRDRLDTIRAYLDEECEFGAELFISRSDLYRQYKEWCAEQGRMAVSATNFNDRLLARHGDLVQLKAVRGERRWSGIGRRSSW
jgi:putative DNA primase/helicase